GGLRRRIEEDCGVEEVDAADLQPPEDGERIVFGYLDGFHRRPLRLTLKDQSIADRALPGKPEPYRRLDTAVLEALVLEGALKMSEDDIAHQHGLGYAKDSADARDAVEAGRHQAAFFMHGTPVEQ